MIENRKTEISSELPLPSSSIARLDDIANETTTMTATIEKELDEAANDAQRERQKELLNAIDLRKFVDFLLYRCLIVISVYSMRQILY